MTFETSERRIVLDGLFTFSEVLVVISSMFLLLRGMEMFA